MWATSKRFYSKFGHQRKPVPLVSVIWHGFLTISFIATGLNWKKINKLLFTKEESDTDIDKSETNSNKMHSKDILL